MACDLDIAYLAGVIDSDGYISIAMTAEQARDLAKAIKDAAAEAEGGAA